MLPFRDYNPTRTFPLVTIALITLNALIFLYMLSLSAQGGEKALDAFMLRAAVVPARFIDGTLTLTDFLTLFTAMFMHGGVVHLLGNMLYLWIFGNNIEDIMGHGRFLLFYLLCGIIATVAHIVAAVSSPDPLLVSIPSLGASGAIAGVLGAYLVRFPRAQVDTCVFFIFVTIIRLPAILVLAFWFVLQLFSGVASLGDTRAASGGVAYWAHIGGFVAGVILVNFFLLGRKKPAVNME